MNRRHPSQIGHVVEGGEDDKAELWWVLWYHRESLGCVSAIGLSGADTVKKEFPGECMRHHTKLAIRRITFG